MTPIVSNVILSISVLSCLLPLIAGRKQYKSLLWTYVAAGFICELLLVLLKRVFTVEYHWVSHLYILVEFILLSLYYHKKTINSRLLAVMLLSGSVFYFFTEFFSDVEKAYNINGVGAAGLMTVYIAYSLSGFYKILREQKILRLERSSFFWANTAILIYAAANIVIFICIDYLAVENMQMLFTLWVFRNTINVIKNIIFARALTLKN